MAERQRARMFDLGFGELLLTAVVALLVLGPERLPRAARVAGLWMRRARASWYSVRAQFERELADDELKRSLQATRKEFDGLRQDLQRPLSLDAPRTAATTISAGAASTASTADDDPDGARAAVDLHVDHRVKNADGNPDSPAATAPGAADAETPASESRGPQ